MSDSLPNLLTASEEFILLDDPATNNLINQFNFDQIPNTDFDQTLDISPHLIVQGTNNQFALNQEVPTNEEYSGPFNFEALIKPDQNNKNQWVYSSALNKMFISMSSLFPVDFKCIGTDKQLYVRATPLFSLPQYAQELVSRCIPHCLGSDSSNINVSSYVWHHVMRCQQHNAVYIGNKDTGDRLSVVVPLGVPQKGTDTVRVLYQFVCKNSCPSGMNRKALEVVFTLEDDTGGVWGRAKFNVRICSCPKRDKEKEEREIRKRHDEGTSHGKRLKLEKPDSGIFARTDTENCNVDFKIIGKHNRDAIFKYAHDLMAGEMVRHKMQEPYKTCLANLDNMMKDSQKNYPN